MTFETILVETGAFVGLITINRPKALNALNSRVIAEINAALDNFEANPDVRCIILTGSEKAFAAGADIREMKDLTAKEARQTDFLKIWDHIATINKPIVAAVSGYCLGGGFELALACDFMVAAESAVFGLPEVALGVLPGVGGTQRLPRLIGKSKAMDMILTGRTITASEAEAMGLVTRVVATGNLMAAAKEIAEKIAAHAGGAVVAAKRAVNESFESPLAAGIKFERSNFYGRFDSPDQKEGMAAFLEKRKAEFSHK